MTHELKDKAVRLRKQGLSYSEILKQVPVAKSTLSLWLRSVGLSKKQKQRLTEKKLAASMRGSQRMRQIRIERTSEIKETARSEAAHLLHNPLWLAGLMLYWAEGSKQKPWRVSQRVALMNMDPEIHKIFRSWLEKFADIKDGGITNELYLHKDGDIYTAQQYWAEALNIERNKIRIYFKPSSLKTNRKNVGQHYYGTFRTNVLKSADLNRRIEGWIEGVIKYLRR